MRVTEQLLQITARNLRQSHEHYGMRCVMVSNVVGVGILSKQLCTLLEVDTHANAIGLGGLVYRDAGEELPPELQCGGTVRGAVNDIGQGKTEFPYRIKCQRHHG